MSTLSKLSSRPHTLSMETHVPRHDVLAAITVVIRKNQEVELAGSIEEQRLALDILDAGVRKLKAYHAQKSGRLVSIDGQPLSSEGVHA